jgi:adenine specific DNA methylase Mod
MRCTVNSTQRSTNKHDRILYNILYVLNSDFIVIVNNMKDIAQQFKPVSTLDVI